MRTYFKYILTGILLFFCFFRTEGRETDRLPSLSLREKYDNFNTCINRNNDAAFRYAHEFLKDIDTSLYYIETAHVYDFLSKYYEQEKFIFSKAIDYQEKALHIYRTLGLQREICYSLVVLARQNIQLGHYNKAFDLAIRSYNLSKKLKDKFCYRESCLCLEDIYYFYYKDVSKVRKYNEVVSSNASNREEAYQQVKAIGKLISYPSRVSNTQVLLEKLVSICDFYDFSSITVYAHLDISLKFGFENNREMSRYYLHKAYTELSNFKDSGYYYAAEGFYYQNIEGNVDQAIQSINKSIRILSKGEFDTKNYYSYNFLKNLYEMKGDYQKAMEASNAFYHIHNKLNDSRIIIQLAESLMSLEKEKTDILYEKQIRKVFFVISALVLLLAISFFFFILFRRQKRLELRNASLLQEKMEQESHAKDELLKIKRLQQYQENTFIDKLLSELGQLKDNTQNKELRNKIYEIMRQLNSSKDKSDWTEVEKSLQGKNSVFYNRLIAKYPDLTPNERKLCTFIHMNMSSKEISNITQQSISSINTARTRLRKKFELTGDEVSLTTFLDQFEKIS